ncbi:MAG TPA: nucleotidyl transferase AbiEii/AbiGii toxin family protein [Pirellulales bacterium]|nr:nucleotidyl transferase AbiEii/AbiGii toxin family protein [Pirellulales bacterium]
MIQILPHIAAEESLALKGGTAINLFVREMPRFSIDIDLTYLPIDTREIALQAVADALGRIKARLAKAIPGIAVTKPPQRHEQDAKLVCNLKQATVKVEVNTVLRGHLWPPREMEMTQAAQEEFQKFAAMQVVSHGELFGGKICAALDRQHPRDLFDVYQLMAHEGLGDDVRLGFIAALLSHSRPIHEVMRPNLQDRRVLFETQFTGMTIEPFTYEDFEATRDRLVREIHSLLTADDRRFLLSFKRGDPDWGLFPVAEVEIMPGVDWKLANIRKLKSQNPRKHAEQLAALEWALTS